MNDKQAQINQALAMLTALDGQENVSMVVEGSGRGHYSCTGILHVEGTKITVSREGGGWWHSLGVDTMGVRSLEVETTALGLRIGVRVKGMLR